MLKIHHGADVICILEEIVTEGMQSKKTVSCVDFVRTCTADLSSTTMMHPLPPQCQVRHDICQRFYTTSVLGKHFIHK